MTVITLIHRMLKDKFITVKPNSEINSRALFLFNGKEYDCTIGSGGVRKYKTEGDLCTPIGTFPLRCLFFRPDRLERPETGLNTIPIEPDDGWCNDPKEKKYNAHVKLPRKGSCESLWREDRVYDIIVPIGYNDSPPVASKGSAIFIHITGKDEEPTHGCIALEQNDLLEIVRGINQNTLIKIEEPRV